MRFVRLTVFVSVLLVTCGRWEHSYSQPNNNGNAHAASERSTNTSNEISLPVRIITTPSDQEKHDAEAKDREDSRNRDESNLAVQRSIAKSSEQVAHYTSLQVWIAVASILFALLTLGTAVTAVLFARKSASAAQDSVEITRHFGEAQTRAYVYAESAVMNWFSDGAQAIITVANCGTTPAKYFSVQGMIDVKYPGDPLGIPPVETDSMSPVYSSLGLNEPKTVAIEGEGVTLSQLSKVANNYVSVRGTITYVTIFDETFISQFSFMIRLNRKDLKTLSKAAGRLDVFMKVADQSLI